MQKITPFFWFDSQAEEAANFYTSLIKDSKVKRVTAAMLEMKKLDLKKLREAYEGNSEKMTVNQKS